TFGAELAGGAAFVLDAVEFDRRTLACRTVITGEGKLDAQSLVGKLVSEIATRARQRGVPCDAVCGVRELDAMGARMPDLERIFEATTLAELPPWSDRLRRRLMPKRAAQSTVQCCHPQERTQGLCRFTGTSSVEPAGIEPATSCLQETRDAN